MGLHLHDGDDEAQGDERVDDALREQCDEDSEEAGDDRADHGDERTQEDQRRQRQRQRNAHDGQAATDRDGVDEGHQ